MLTHMRRMEFQQILTSDQWPLNEDLELLEPSSKRVLFSQINSRSQE